jgi:hypothetical protein
MKMNNEIKKLQMFLGCFLFGFWIPIMFFHSSISSFDMWLTFIVLFLNCVLSIFANVPKVE